MPYVPYINIENKRLRRKSRKREWNHIILTAQISDAETAKKIKKELAVAVHKLNLKLPDNEQFSWEVDINS